MNDTPEFKMIPIEDLRMDDLNPRLPKSLHGQAEGKIIEYLLLEASTLELMQAIGENDFFIGEQLLVVEEDGDKHKVVEGNRRLTAVKLLQDCELTVVLSSKVKQVYEEAEYHPTEIPCLVFSDEEKILKYLGYRHITGIKSWGLLEKARYLNRLKDDMFPDDSFEKVCRELAKMIGSRMDYVRRILAGYQIYLGIEDEAFYKIRDLDDTTFFFGYIADSLNRTNITKFLGVDFTLDKPVEGLSKENVKKWTYWLFEKNDQNKTRLKGKSGDLNKLNSILGVPDALKAFDEKGLEFDKAYELTRDLDILFESAVKKSIDSLEQADGLVHKVKQFYSDVEDDLNSINRLASKIKHAKDDFENVL